MIAHGPRYKQLLDFGIVPARGRVAEHLGLLDGFAEIALPDAWLVAGWDEPG